MNGSAIEDATLDAIVDSAIGHWGAALSADTASACELARARLLQLCAGD